MKKLPDALVCSRNLVANKNCKVVQYELKTFHKLDQENIDVFRQELESLLRLQHLACVVKLMDVIEDEESISLLLLSKGSETLRKSMTKMRSDASQIEFALQTIKKLSEIVEKIYRKKVMHRSLNLDCVIMDCSGDAPRVYCIQDFDTSYYLKGRWMIKQRFMIEDKMMPPEVKVGEA